MYRWRRAGRSLGAAFGTRLGYYLKSGSERSTSTTALPGGMPAFANTPAFGDPKGGSGSARCCAVDWQV